MPSRPPAEHVGVVEMSAILEGSFGRPLLQAGFVRVTARKWIWRRTPDIADLFEVQALKGLNYSPVWGFSLSYVPLVQGGRLRYPKTDKAARLDYRHDPLDMDPGASGPHDEWLISQAFGAGHARSSARRAARKAVPQALALFSRVKGIDELSELYAQSLEAHRARPPYRFGFFNYGQFPIAYAFALSRQGQYQAGAAVLREAMGYGIDYGAALEQLLASMKAMAESS